jgi:hypothetical protein
LLQEIELSTMYQQPVLPVVDPAAFSAVKASVESRFSSNQVADFMKSLERMKVRVRDFEGVLRKGLLGTTAAGEYSKLGNADQGQIRELYLATLEKVAPEVRQRFFKLYAYY